MRQRDFFNKVVQDGINKQKDFAEETPSGNTNPFFIGFGNPEADIIIFGQEKAIKPEFITQIWLENNQNVNQWKKYLNGEITERHQRLYSNVERYFQNPLQPYRYYPDGGTWKNYQTIISSIYPEIKKENSEATFLERTFITEINHKVALQQMGYQNDTLRKAFLNQDFFKNFPVTILAIGGYLKSEAIKDWFEVDFIEDHSQPYRKLLVYKSQDSKRLVLQTRQMSRLMINIEKRTAYFSLIRQLTQEHLKIKTR